MPKAETRDYFNVTIRGVSKDALGELHAVLAQLAYTDVTSEYVTDVITFNKNKKVPHNIKSEEYLAEWTGDHPTFKAIDAVNHFRADGRTDGACYTALRHMTANKFLKRIGEGQYSRGDIKALPAPKASKAGISLDRREVNHYDFIMKLARKNHGKFNTAWMKAQFEKDGRKWMSVSPSIAVLLKKKALKRVDNSNYIVTAKAVTRKSNGAADAVRPELEVTANG